LEAIKSQLVAAASEALVTTAISEVIVQLRLKAYIGVKAQ